MYNLSFTLSDKAFEFWNKFALEVDKQKYVIYGKNRNQNKKYIRVYQNTLAKMAEAGVYKIFIQNKLPCSMPSSKVLTSPTWDSDLISDDFRIHVKNQPPYSRKTFGISWTFQVGGQGKGNIDPIYGGKYDSKDLAAFTSISDDERTVTLEALVQVELLHKYKLFKFIDGVDLPHLKEIKKFVHLNDIKLTIPNLFYFESLRK